MARTVDEIYQGLTDEQASYANLAALAHTDDDLPSLLQDIGSTPSEVGRWSLMKWIFAYGTWLLETLWDGFQAAINDALANKEPGTLPWYKGLAFKFQYGDALIYQNNKWQYATITTANQIVNLCAVTETGGVIRVKAARLAGTVVTPLAANELTALDAYYQLLKFAGPPLTVISDAADRAWIPYTVYYNPLSDQPTVQAAVEAAINGYLAGISGVTRPESFNGVFDLEALDQAIMAVAGVQDIVRGAVQATYGAVPYQPVQRKYATNAGYIVVDPLHPLAATITYLPNS